MIAAALAIALLAAAFILGRITAPDASFSDADAVIGGSVKSDGAVPDGTEPLAVSTRPGDVNIGIAPNVTCDGADGKCSQFISQSSCLENANAVASVSFEGSTASTSYSDNAPSTATVDSGVEPLDKLVAITPVDDGQGVILGWRPSSSTYPITVCAVVETTQDGDTTDVPAWGVSGAYRLRSATSDIETVQLYFYDQRRVPGYGSRIRFANLTTPYLVD